MTIFKLPDLGEGLPDAEIHEWYVAEGDEVAVDQPLVSMETAKAVVDIPSPVKGRVVKLHGKAGDIIQTDAPLVEFITEKSYSPSPSQDSGTVVGVIETSDAILQEPITGILVPARAASQVKATPAVRMLANTLGVDLSTIQGSGPQGTISTQDVKAAVQSTSNPTPVIGDPLQGPRRAMAQFMTQSHTQVVPVTLMEDADLHRWAEKTNVTLRLLQAIIAACQQEPALNAHFYGHTLSRKIRDEINLAIAVDTPAGLYAPVIKDAAKQSAESLRATIDYYKEKAKLQAFSPADLQDGTITLSNFGTICGRYANPIVMPPSVAIIGIGKSRPMLVAWEGKPAVHLIMPISLTFDHRAVTGGEAARFMAVLIGHLEKT